MAFQCHMKEKITIMYLKIVFVTFVGVNYSDSFIRATEILKSKSVRSTDDVIGTCVRQSQIVTKTNDSSFSSKSVSEIDYLSNTL